MCKTKAIFLDIDGVLNWQRSESRAPSGVIGVDDERVKRLRKIVEATNSIIVLTSTWQMSFFSETCISSDANYLIKKLNRRGMRIHGKTGKWGDDRGQGIIEWLQKNPEIESWIVLDDEVFPDFKEYGILPRLVQTSFVDGGLQDEHVEKAITMLNSDNG